MILHLSSPSLPHLCRGFPPFDSHCLEVRCGCSGPHESTLVSRAVGALSNLHLSPSCLPLPGSALDQLSPSWLPGSPLSKKGVDALDLLILDLSPTCLPVCCRCSGPNEPTWLALRVLWAPWFCTCLPLLSQYAVDALSCMVLHLSPTCPALVSDCLAVCFGFSGLPDSTLVSRLSPTVSQHAVGALGNMTLHLVTGQKKLSPTKQSLYIYVCIYLFIFIYLMAYLFNDFLFMSMSNVHLIIGVPDFDLYALVPCLSPTAAKYSVGVSVQHD